MRRYLGICESRPLPTYKLLPSGDKPNNSRRKRLSTASKARTASKMFQDHSCAKRHAWSLQMSPKPTKRLVTSLLQVASSSEKKCSAVRTHTRSPANGHTPPELRTLRCAQGRAEHQLHQEPGGEDDLQAVHLRCPRGALQGHAVGVPGAAGLPKAFLSGARHESVAMEDQEDGVGEDHEGGEDLTQNVCTIIKNSIRVGARELRPIQHILSSFSSKPCN